MATRGRQPGFRMTEHHRDKIAKSQILRNLIACAEGEIEMSPVRAQVSLGLLKKIMPDLAQVQQDTEVSGKLVIEWAKTEE